MCVGLVGVGGSEAIVADTQHHFRFGVGNLNRHLEGIIELLVFNLAGIPESEQGVKRGDTTLLLDEEFDTLGSRVPPYHIRTNSRVEDGNEIFMAQELGMLEEFLVELLRIHIASDLVVQELALQAFHSDTVEIDSIEEAIERRILALGTLLEILDEVLQRTSTEAVVGHLLREGEGSLNHFHTLQERSEGYDALEQTHLNRMGRGEIDHRVLAQTTGLLKHVAIRLDQRGAADRDKLGVVQIDIGSLSDYLPEVLVEGIHEEPRESEEMVTLFRFLEGQPIDVDMQTVVGVETGIELVQVDVLEPLGPVFLLGCRRHGHGDHLIPIALAARDGTVTLAQEEGGILRIHHLIDGEIGGALQFNAQKQGLGLLLRILDDGTREDLTDVGGVREVLVQRGRVTHVRLQS